MTTPAQQNATENAREIAQGAEELSSLPRRLIVTLTTACNSQCIMCEVKNSSWEIDARTIDGILRLLPTLESVAWQGGEVFIWEPFASLFDAASRFPGLRQTAVTNAQALTDHWIEKLLAANMELAISVDGTTPDVYERIRAGSRFSVLTDALARIARARAAAPNRLTLRMHTVLMRSNLGELDAFIEFARAQGFDALHLMPIWGTQAPHEDLFSSADPALLARIAAGVRSTRERAAAYGIEFMHSLPLHEPAPPRPVVDVAAPAPERPACPEAGTICTLPWQQLNIDPGGEVRPGCLCSRSIGSVHAATLQELWNGEAIRRYRRCLVRDAGSGLCNPACLNGSIPRVMRGI